MTKKPVLEKIYATFGEVARTLGYSPIHGKIIAALAANGREMSLQETARETGYSISMVSLSLDLLDVMGVIQKSRKPRDRNLYISLKGDLLETLKTAIVMRLSKSIDSTLTDFSKTRQELTRLPRDQRLKAQRSVEVLEKEILRLQTYVSILKKARLP